MDPQHQATCLEALRDAVGEVAATVLGGVPVAAAPAVENLDPASCHGAYLALVAQEEPIQVALLANAAGCQTLSKLLLGMDAADEDLPDADVSDAMCEVINIVAGGLKRRVSAELKVTLGLPLFVAGPLMPNQMQQVHGSALSLGDVQVVVLLLTQRENAEPISKSGVNQIAATKLAKEQSA
ncbi:MAG TPA: chemotaxis protein CheX [Polyangiaceae bacterium]|nr:chemotaxis protein CheX [Polyangiaceae bacterium]